MIIYNIKKSPYNGNVQQVSFDIDTQKHATYTCKQEILPINGVAGTDEQVKDMNYVLQVGESLVRKFIEKSYTDDVNSAQILQEMNREDVNSEIEFLRDLVKSL